MMRFRIENVRKTSRPHYRFHSAFPVHTKTLPPSFVHMNYVTVLERLRFSFQVTYHCRTKKDNSNTRTLYLSAYDVDEFESWLSSLRLGT